ncbi:MAG: hypothetical protein KU37_06910 [Sulfuricurvum sp. PC08-66]|nr:MAG: hypothetical protein KU37_06910 [Sulfuricurvum sp. PC08-66]
MEIRDPHTIQKLEGPWGFVLGEALLPHQTTQITTTLEMPQYLENMGIGAVGVATIVLDIRATPEVELGIDFIPLWAPWRLYTDEVLIAQSGTIDVQKGIFLATNEHVIARFTPKREVTRLTLWVANSQHRHFGLSASPQIASYEKLANAKQMRIYLDLIIVTILVIAGVYHLGLFVAWRKDTSPLWFGLFVLAFALRIATTDQKILACIFESISWEMLVRMEYGSGYMTLPLFILYTHSLYPRYANVVLIRLNILLGVLFLATALFLPTITFTAWLPLSAFVIIESVLLVAWILWRSYVRKEPNSLFALVTFLLFGMTIFHDVLMYFQYIDASYDWVHIGFIFYLLAQAQILVFRYANAYRGLQHNEEQLERTVRLRTLELQNLLGQRELLLRELNHRVKNNLQFIIGLLWTKRAHACPETQETLLALQSQITAIATVHDMLCAQPNISSIEGVAYLHSLCDALGELYKEVTFHTTLQEGALLSMEDAIALGLVLSELVSNTIKHAFEDGKGVIEIGFEVHKGKMLLRYSDGKTHYMENDFLVASHTKGGMGWSMILGLVRQLRGTIIPTPTSLAIVCDVEAKV